MLGAIISWVVIGLVVGALARLLLPGRDPMGILMTILVGIGGSFVGGFLANLLFRGQLEVSAAGFGGSLIGAIIILLVLRASRSRRLVP